MSLENIQSKKSVSEIQPKEQTESSASLLKRSASETPRIENNPVIEATPAVSRFSLKSIKESFSQIIENVKESYQNWKREEASPATRARNPITNFLATSTFGSQEDRREISNYTLNNLARGVERGEIEPVSIRNSQGNDLKGYFHKAEAAKDTGKVVLFLSGSAGSAEKWSEDIASKYKREGISTMAVNYRGFGESVGVPSENGLYKDAKAMFDHLVNEKGVDPKNIIIHGFSLGGPVAAELVKRVQSENKEIGGLFLDRPMVSLSKAASAHMGEGKLGYLAGQISKSIGTFSIDKKFDQISVNTKVLLMNDSDVLGPKGEQLRERLLSRGFAIGGEKVINLSHEDSNSMMRNKWDRIRSLFN